MNLIFFIRISTREEIYTSVLFYKECYLGACAFISPAHFLMIKCGGQDRSGWVRGERKAAKALKGMHYFLIWDVLHGFRIWLLKRDAHEVSYETDTDSDVENRLVVAKEKGGDRLGGWD